MTSEIVAKLITFINGYTSVKKLNLTWYGGEPLMAFNKIKYIVDKINASAMSKSIHRQLLPMLAAHRIK